MLEKDNDFEKILAINIGLLANHLKIAGLKMDELDNFAEHTLQFIRTNAELITKKVPLECDNVENIIIMLLMHGAMTTQRQFIEETAKRLGVSPKKIMEEMSKDTIKELNTNKSNKGQI